MKEGTPDARLLYPQWSEPLEYDLGERDDTQFSIVFECNSGPAGSNTLSWYGNWIEVSMGGKTYSGIGLSEIADLLFTDPNNFALTDYWTSDCAMIFKSSPTSDMVVKTKSASGSSGTYYLYQLLGANAPSENWTDIDYQYTDGDDVVHPYICGFGPPHPAFTLDPGKFDIATRAYYWIGDSEHGTFTLHDGPRTATYGPGTVVDTITYASSYAPVFILFVINDKVDYSYRMFNKWQADPTLTSKNDVQYHVASGVDYWNFGGEPVSDKNWGNMSFAPEDFFKLVTLDVDGFKFKSDGYAHISGGARQLQFSELTSTIDIAKVPISDRPPHWNYRNPYSYFARVWCQEAVDAVFIGGADSDVGLGLDK